MQRTTAIAMLIFSSTLIPSMGSAAAMSHCSTQVDATWATNCKNDFNALVDTVYRGAQGDRIKTLFNEQVCSKFPVCETTATGTCQLSEKWRSGCGTVVRNIISPTADASTSVNAFTSKYCDQPVCKESAN